MTKLNATLIAAAILIGSGLILALGRATGTFEIGSNTLAASLTIIGVILAVGAELMKGRENGPC